MYYLLNNITFQILVIDFFFEGGGILKIELFLTSSCISITITILVYRRVKMLSYTTSDIVQPIRVMRIIHAHTYTWPFKTSQRERVC